MNIINILYSMRWAYNPRIDFPLHLIFDNCRFQFLLMSLKYFERVNVYKTWNYKNQFELETKNFELKLFQLKI
jgi:hypothetical protein